MAATISNLANGVSTTNNTTCATGATVTASVGNWLVVIAASSNDGANGAASQSGVVDSDGVNTYTNRILVNYDPGAGGAGATLGVYTCQVTQALSNDTITVNHSANTTEKAVQVYKLVPGAGETISYIGGNDSGLVGNKTSHNGGTATGVESGDIVFGAAAIETDDAVTGDSDTTNGNWSAILTRLADNGTDGVTMSCASQYKQTTGTGDQTWTCTTAAGRDSAASYIVIRSAVSSADFALSKTLGTLTSSGASTVAIDAAFSKTLGTLTASSAFKLDTNSALLAKTLGSLTTSAASTVAIDATFSKTLGTLTASATLTAEAPSADFALSQTLGSLTGSAAATVAIDAAFTKTLGAITSSGAATVSTDAALAKTLGTLTSAGAATVGDDASLAKTLGTLTSSGAASVGTQAAASNTLGSLTASAATTVNVSALLSMTLASLTASSTIGDVTPPASSTVATQNIPRFGRLNA